MSIKKRPKIPPLLGSKEVASMLGVRETSIPGYRKLKNFPEPIVYIGGRPIWWEEEILQYISCREKRRSE
jgi:predicted DNA-binding transcriptional regulator AlpA